MRRLRVHCIWVVVVHAWIWSNAQALLTLLVYDGQDFELNKALSLGVGLLRTVGVQVGVCRGLCLSWKETLQAHHPLVIDT